MENVILATLSVKEACYVLEALADVGAGIREEPTHTLFRKIKAQVQISRDRVNKLEKETGELIAKLKKESE
jgi:hypothetical protein